MSDTADMAGVAPGCAEQPLTPTQRVVWGILYGAPGGACRRDFAAFDVWEVANRITEIEDRLGITISRDRCTVHNHRHRVVRYKL